MLRKTGTHFFLSIIFFPYKMLKNTEIACVGAKFDISLVSDTLFFAFSKKWLNSYNPNNPIIPIRKYFQIQKIQTFDHGPLMPIESITYSPGTNPIKIFCFFLSMTFTNF